MILSTQADTSLRISTSGSRSTCHPCDLRYPSLRRSLRNWLSRPCQYVPSASTAKRASSNAISTMYGPTLCSTLKTTSRLVSSACSNRSIELVRGQVCDTHAPAHLREQKRNRAVSDGLTIDMVPQNSHRIGIFGLCSGWFAPVIRRFASSLQAREQYRRRFASPPDITISAPQISHWRTTAGNRFAGEMPTRALSAHGLEQYLALPDSEGFTENSLPHCMQVSTIGSLAFVGRRPLLTLLAQGTEQNLAPAAILLGGTSKDDPQVSHVNTVDALFQTFFSRPASEHDRLQNLRSARLGYLSNCFPQWAQLVVIMRSLYHPAPVQWSRVGNA